MPMPRSRASAGDPRATRLAVDEHAARVGRGRRRRSSSAGCSCRRRSRRRARAPRRRARRGARRCWPAPRRSACVKPSTCSIGSVVGATGTRVDILTPSRVSQPATAAVASSGSWPGRRAPRRRRGRCRCGGAADPPRAARSCSSTASTISRCSTMLISMRSAIRKSCIRTGRMRALTLSSVSVSTRLPDARLSVTWKDSSSSMNEPSGSGGAAWMASQRRVQRLERLGRSCSTPASAARVMPRSSRVSRSS